MQRVERHSLMMSSKAALNEAVVREARTPPAPPSVCMGFPCHKNGTKPVYRRGESLTVVRLERFYRTRLPEVAPVLSLYPFSPVMLRLCPSLPFGYGRRTAQPVLRHFHFISSRNSPGKALSVAFLSSFLTSSITRSLDPAVTRKQWIRWPHRSVLQDIYFSTPRFRWYGKTIAHSP